MAVAKNLLFESYIERDACLWRNGAATELLKRIERS